VSKGVQHRLAQHGSGVLRDRLAVRTNDRFIAAGPVVDLAQDVLDELRQWPRELQATRYRAGTGTDADAPHDLDGCRWHHGDWLAGEEQHSGANEVSVQRRICDLGDTEVDERETPMTPSDNHRSTGGRPTEGDGGGHADAQAIVEAEQALSDLDQTHSDADQTTSDATSARLWLISGPLAATSRRPSLTRRPQTATSSSVARQIEPPIARTALLARSAQQPPTSVRRALRFVVRTRHTYGRRLPARRRGPAARRQRAGPRPSQRCS